MAILEKRGKGDVRDRSFAQSLLSASFAFEIMRRPDGLSVRWAPPFCNLLGGTRSASTITYIPTLVPSTAHRLQVPWFEFGDAKEKQNCSGWFGTRVRHLCFLATVLVVGKGPARFVIRLKRL